MRRVSFVYAILPTWRKQYEEFQTEDCCYEIDLQEAHYNGEAVPLYHFSHVSNGITRNAGSTIDLERCETEGHILNLLETVLWC